MPPGVLVRPAASISSRPRQASMRWPRSSRMRSRCRRRTRLPASLLCRRVSPGRIRSWCVGLAVVTDGGSARNRERGVPLSLQRIRSAVGANRTRSEEPARHQGALQGRDSACGDRLQVPAQESCGPRSSRARRRRCGIACDSSMPPSQSRGRSRCQSSNSPPEALPERVRTPRGRGMPDGHRGSTRTNQSRAHPDRPAGDPQPPTGGTPKTGLRERSHSIGYRSPQCPAATALNRPPNPE